ncbi:MAG: hypothetical protein SPI74_06605 [Eubacterium sp.]|nr:hypothetical protein [Eubacterium sp.]
MKRIKDFFYNFNDIVIVLCVLTLAVLLIVWRVDIIMRYPKTVAAKSVELSKDSKSNNQTASAKNSKTKTSEPSTNADSEDPSKTNADSDDNPNVNDGTVWKDGKLIHNMSVEVPQGSATAAVDGLVQAGLFTSYEDFAAVSAQLGLDPTSIMPGTYKFDAGATQADITATVLSR